MGIYDFPGTGQSTNQPKPKGNSGRRVSSESYVGMGGQDAGFTERSVSRSAITSTAVILGISALALAFIYITPDMSPNAKKLLSAISGTLGTSVLLSIIAFFGGHFDFPRIVRAALLWSIGAVTISFFGGLGLYGAFASFVLMVLILDYVGFKPFTSFFITLFFHIAIGVGIFYLLAHAPM